MIKITKYFKMQNQDQQNGTGDYHLVTTISMPVYDRRENAVSCFQLNRGSRSTSYFHNKFNY